MKRNIVTMTVGVALDPIPGQMHEPEDAVRVVQQLLDAAFSHYNPVVKPDETFGLDVLQERDDFKSRNEWLENELAWHQSRSDDLAKQVAALNEEIAHQARRNAVAQGQGDHRLPIEWCVELGYEVMDPDGWRDGTRSWDEPITEAEFEERVRRCTMRRVIPKRAEGLTLVYAPGMNDAALFQGDERIDTGHTDDLSERLIEGLGVRTEHANIIEHPHAGGWAGVFRSLAALRNQKGDEE